MEEFRKFEKFQVGNYVEHNGRLRRIEGIGNEDVYTLKDIVYGDILKSGEPVSGIKLNEELVAEFGFKVTPRNNRTYLMQKLSLYSTFAL